MEDPTQTEFVSSNPAKEFRNAILAMYDQLLWQQAQAQQAAPSSQEATATFLKKAATLALNLMGEQRQDFLMKYAQNYRISLASSAENPARKSSPAPQQEADQSPKEQEAEQVRIVGSKEEMTDPVPKFLNQANGNEISVIQASASDEEKQEQHLYEPDISLQHEPGVDLTTPLKGASLRSIGGSKQRQPEESPAEPLPKPTAKLTSNYSPTAPEEVAKDKQMAEVPLRQPSERSVHTSSHDTPSSLPASTSLGTALSPADAPGSSVAPSDESEKTRLVLRDQVFSENFNFDSLFHAYSATSSPLNVGERDVFKKLEVIEIQRCEFLDYPQFCAFIKTLKTHVSVVGVLKDSTLKRLTIKNLSIRNQDLANPHHNQIEMQVVNAFSFPLLNSQMYSHSLEELELTLSWTQVVPPGGLNDEALQTQFQGLYANFLVFFRTLGSLEKLSIISKGTPNFSSSYLLDTILGRHLPQSNMRNLKSVRISGSEPTADNQNEKLLSDFGAKDFFSKVLANQKELTEISMPNLNLRGDTICTMLYTVILRAPSLVGGEGSPGTKEAASQFSGCFRKLKVLDLSGNKIDATHLDAKTFLSIFDFLESIEELNIERLRFESFKSFKTQFMVDFFSNRDYKPYMMTLKKLNFSIGDPIFYGEDNLKMSHTTAKTLLDQILENFNCLKEVRLDFFSAFLRKAVNRQSYIEKFKAKGIDLKMSFKDALGYVDESENEDSDDQSQQHIDLNIHLKQSMTNISKGSDPATSTEPEKPQEDLSKFKLQEPIYNQPQFTYTRERSPSPSQARRKPASKEHSATTKPEVLFSSSSTTSQMKPYIPSNPPGHQAVHHALAEPRPSAPRAMQAYNEPGHYKPHQAVQPPPQQQMRPPQSSSGMPQQHQVRSAYAPSTGARGPSPRQHLPQTKPMPGASQGHYSQIPHSSHGSQISTGMGSKPSSTIMSQQQPPLNHRQMQQPHPYEVQQRHQQQQQRPKDGSDEKVTFQKKGFSNMDWIGDSESFQE